MGRLTPEREASIREAHRDNGPIDDCWMCNVIGEIDALRAENERFRDCLRKLEAENLRVCADLDEECARIAELERELAAAKAQKEKLLAAAKFTLRFHPLSRGQSIDMLRDAIFTSEPQACDEKGT